MAGAGVVPQIKHTGFAPIRGMMIPPALRWQDGAWDFNLDHRWEMHLMDDPPERHREAAEHHDSSAERHDRAARFWEEQGDAERATLQRDMAAWERGAADLERRWAAIVEREAR